MIYQWKGLSKLADSCSSLQGFISVSFSGWYTDAVILLDNEAIYDKCKKYFHLPKLLPNLLILILSFNGNPSLRTVQVVCCPASKSCKCHILTPAKPWKLENFSADTLRFPIEQKTPPLLLFEKVSQLIL